MMKKVLFSLQSQNKEKRKGFLFLFCRKKAAFIENPILLLPPPPPPPPLLLLLLLCQKYVIYEEIDQICEPARRKTNKQTNK